MLNTEKYIISPALQNVLQWGKLSLPDAYLDTKDKHPKGLYLIMFKVINLDSRVLFYNYIYYPDIFLPVVLNYMYNRVNIYDYCTAGIVFWKLPSFCWQWTYPWAQK